MSDTPIEVLRIKEIIPHPQADRLEIAKVLGTQFVAGKGDFQAGDLCFYFPPDMLIPEDMGKKLGVVNYLKHAIFPGDLEKSKCRIGAIRLRGVPSFGFGVPIDDSFVTEGTDVTDVFNGVKYQPPSVCSGDSMRSPAAFHEYTDIQHYYRHAEALEGVEVRICEKLHGTNARVALIDNEFMVGSHHRRMKHEDAHGRPSLYWEPLTDNMREMLAYVPGSSQSGNVIVFGEIYGNKIQSMDYGCLRSFRVFDISVDGEYLDWSDVWTYCQMFDIETVPVLYEGLFSPELIDEYASGPTTLAPPEQIKCSFKGREGIVITALSERYFEGGRLILKAVSPDYYAK